tara:strand:+ start:1419 stop:2930 length:1512 start_codon:yes stop_codon:yes gene_type:complete
MKLPNLEEYINAIQLGSSKVFTDSILKNCTVQKNALGLPRVRSGNFAVIFKLQISNLNFAVRCFLTMPESSVVRYSSIKEKINSNSIIDSNSIFSRFDYQKQGILVNQNYYPVIKMRWIEGPTLGEFINQEYQNQNIMYSLKKSLRQLFIFLLENNVAHGDIQPGNLIVKDSGGKIKLIDYDGMYTPEIKCLGASEIGHVNFQHPQRNKKYFSVNLDFFSFILLDTAITCIINNPNLWEESFSDEEGILFRAEDLRNPRSSFIFDAISKTKNCKNIAQNFATICLNNFEKIPNPLVFYNGELTTKKIIIFKPELTKKPILSKTNGAYKIGPYISSNQVLCANSIELVIKNTGKRVELIGKVYDVRVGKAQFENSIKLRPYIYLDFNSMSSGKVFRVKFLPEIVENAKLSSRLLPDCHWNGKWVTITETIQSTQIINHPSFANGLKETSVLISNANQIKIIAESEAFYRLGKEDSHIPYKLKNNSRQENQGKSNQNIVSIIKNL